MTTTQQPQQPQQTSPPSPPSSPAPSKPPSLTPGPRATAFLNLYTSALDSTLKSISYASFSSCFPTISHNADPALQAMHAGMINRLGDFAREEFEDIVRERKVVERVNGLEGIVGEARSRMMMAGDENENGEAQKEKEGGGRIAPHTLPPSLLIRSHTLPLHIAQNSQLNARLQTTQSQNATLIDEIRQQRKEIEELMKLVERGVKDVEGAGEILVQKKIGELSAEAREKGEILDG